MAGRKVDHWSDLSARSKRRLRAEGVGPAQYNAWKKAPPAERQEIRRSVRETGLSGPAFRTARDHLQKTPKYRDFWRDAKKQGVSRDKFDRQYVRVFGQANQARRAGRPRVRIDRDQLQALYNLTVPEGEEVYLDVSP